MSTQFASGCYFAGARGDQATGRLIVEFAKTKGFAVSHPNAKRATDFMNAVHAVEGHWWGFFEGYWGLWPNDID